MRFWNHYRMGRLMYANMAKNGIRLNEWAFVLGNLAPDISLSYLYRQHSREVSAPYLAKQLEFLYGGSAAYGDAGFSYSLGVMSHYVCDFLCYPHTTAFKGGAREHIIHENNQMVGPADLLPFNKKNSVGMDLDKLARILDKYISRHERLFARDEASGQNDVPIAMHVSTWAAAGAYLFAETSAALNPPAARFGEPPLMAEA